MKQWLKELFSQGGKVSSKRIAYITVIFSSIGWMTSNLIAEGMTANWVLAFQSLLAAVGAGYISGIFSEKKSKDTDVE